VLRSDGTRDLEHTKNEQLVLMHAIFRRAVKVWRLPRNPVANIDRYRIRQSDDIEVFSPEGVWALVRAATSEMVGVVFLTAAFTGLRRGELLAVPWARCRLRGFDDQGSRQLRGRPADHAQVRKGQVGTDGSGRRQRPGGTRSTGALHGRR
jgi:hypothetical protein